MAIEADLQTVRRPRWKPVLLVGFVAVFFLVFVILAAAFIFVYQQRANKPKADERLRTLEKEFNLIPPIADAYQLRYESSHKVSLGSVGADYNTDKSYAEIRAHYDKELKKNGWTFVEERPVTIWWRDYGGKEAFYCKDHYNAMVEYAGGWEDAGWTYTFNMSWGIFDVCK